jgi:hypothetical protein
MLSVIMPTFAIKAIILSGIILTVFLLNVVTPILMDYIQYWSIVLLNYAGRTENLSKLHPWNENSTS